MESKQETEEALKARLLKAFQDAKANDDGRCVARADLPFKGRGDG